MKKLPNLIVVFADQWRRQALGCMNADPVITPNMDRFASEGMVFENALSCNPVCTPNRAALLTGKHPYAVNMMYNWLRLPVEEDTIAKVCKRQGYDTGYIGKWHLDEWDGDPEFGDAYNTLTPAGERRMGFDFWYSAGCRHKHFLLNYLTTDNDKVTGEGWQVDHETDKAIDYIENREKVRDEDKPFCLFLSWSPPHTNHGGPHYDPDNEGFQYNAPEQYEAMYRGEDIEVRDNADPEMFREGAPGYFGAVTSMDDNFGRLLKSLDNEGISENTIVVLTSDHGECLGSHGMFTKGVWWEESIGIPFIVKYTGTVPVGAREDMLLNTPDIMPTLVGLMGLQVPEDLHGKDFSHVCRGAAGDRRKEAFLSFNGGSPFGLSKWNIFADEGNRKWRGVKTDRYTYVAASREQYGDPAKFCKPLPEGVKQVLYDNDNDPFQMNPIFPGEGKDHIIKELHRKLENWLESLGDPFLTEDWY